MRRTGQIEKRGEGVYRLRWYTGRVEGRRTYGSKTLRGTRKRAERELREILAKQDHGQVVPSAAHVPTLRAYVERWKTSPAAQKLRERTQRDYLYLLEHYVLPRLGDLRLDSIHTATVEDGVVKPLSEKKHLRTASLAVSALSRVLRSAAKDRTLGLSGNPCRGVEVDRAPRREIRPLTAEERVRFREAIRGTEYEALWLLLMFTGLSPNEALALGWEHVDLDAGSVRIVRTVDTKTRRLVNDTKRPSRKRTVPFAGELRRKLRERWLAAGKPAEGLLFCSRDGRPPSLDGLRAKHFRAVINAAKIDRSVRIYDLRHGFATSGLEAGLDVKDVATLMGHSSTQTTQDIYQHVSEQRKRVASEKIGASLEGATG